MRTTRAVTTTATLLLAAALVAAMSACGDSIGGTPTSGGAAPPPATTTAAEPTTEEPTTTSDEPMTDPDDVPAEAACALLTKAEAEALIGTGLGDGVPTGGGGGSLCMYTAPPDGPVGQVETFIGPGAKKFYDIDVELGHEFDPVDGIGDEAHYEDGAIFVRKGDQWAGVRLVSLSGTDVKDAMIAAARLVAERM